MLLHYSVAFIALLLLNSLASAKFAVKFMFSTLQLVTALRTVSAEIVRSVLSFFSFVILWLISSSAFTIHLFVFWRVGGDGMFYLRSSLTDWSHFYLSAASLIYDAMNRPPPERIKILFLSFRNLFINSLLCIQMWWRGGRKSAHYQSKEEVYNSLHAAAS